MSSYKHFDHMKTKPDSQISKRGDGVAHWVERSTRDPKTRGSNPGPVRSTRQIRERFSEPEMLC